MADLQARTRRARNSSVRCLRVVHTLCRTHSTALVFRDGVGKVWVLGPVRVAGFSQSVDLGHSQFQVPAQRQSLARRNSRPQGSSRALVFRNSIAAGSRAPDTVAVQGSSQQYCPGGGLSQMAWCDPQAKQIERERMLFRLFFY